MKVRKLFYSTHWITQPVILTLCLLIGYSHLIFIVSNKIKDVFVFHLGLGTESLYRLKGRVNFIKDMKIGFGHAICAFKYFITEIISTLP